DAKALFETMVDGGGQGFAGRDCIADCRKIELATIVAVMGEQGGKIRWNRKEQRGPVTLDGFKHILRLGWARIEDAGGSHGKRKVEGIAQSVGEEKFGHTEAAICVADIQDGFGITLGTDY